MRSNTPLPVGHNTEGIYSIRNKYVNLLSHIGDFNKVNIKGS